jgi:hypothetical protein
MNQNPAARIAAAPASPTTPSKVRPMAPSDATSTTRDSPRAANAARASHRLPRRRGSRYRLRRADSHPVAPHVTLVRVGPPCGWSTIGWSV